MADLTLVQGETRDIYIVLADRDGPVSAGTFSSIIYDIFSGGSVIQSCTGVQLASGRVKFSFDSTDTATPGMYSGHVRAVRGDDSVTFFPSERAHSVEIRESGSGTPLPPPDVDYVVSINGETGTVTLSLNDISDVDTTGFANGEVLTYDSGSGNWVPSAAAGGGVTSVSGTAPIVSSGGATPAISITAASTTASGAVELATDAETQTGTDTTRAPSLASAAATFLRKLLTTGTTGTITHADGGIWRFVSVFGTAALGLRATADANDRASLGATGVAWGDGTSTADAGFSRTGAGVMGMFGSSKFRPGTPSASGDAADKNYVDTRTPAASTSASGLVELATTAETQTGTDTARAITPAGGAATYQPLDSDLTAIAALSTTAYGRALLALADAAAGRTALGLGTLATASTVTSSDITDGTIVNININAAAAIAGTKVDAATDTVRGTVELATAAEVLTGTDTARAPTPSVIAPFAKHTRVSGALAETVPRHFPDSAITLSSGCLHLVAISLPAGLPITSVTFVSGAGLTGLSNQWFGLFDSSRIPLRLTGDDTSTAWALNTAKTLNLSSTYATTTAGLYYLGICVVASGMGTIAAQTSTSIMTGFAPIISGSSSTGLTNPASCPNPAGAMAAISTIPFAYVS